MGHVTKSGALLLALATAVPLGCGGAPEPGESGEPRMGTFLIFDEPVELQYEIDDGLMVTEHDIVLDAADEIASGDDARVEERALFAQRSNARLWPGGVIPYKIHSSVTTPARVKKAMSEWATKTHVRFKPRTSEDAFMLIKEEPGNRVCRAQVGYTGGKRIVYLRDTSLGAACSLGVVTHEIGHVLGFWHEHTRDDRDSYVKILWDYVADPAAFTKKTVGVRKVGSYDMSSTMHYRSFTYSSPTSKASIKKKDGSLLLHDWETLSAKDIAATNQLYP